MPLAKIHVLEGQYDERRLNVSKAVQALKGAHTIVPGAPELQRLRET